MEIALYDLAGRAAGKPVHALLGDKKRSRMPLLGVIGGGDFAGDLNDAQAKKTDGFTAYKIKVGTDTPANDAKRTRDLPGARAGLAISADANQGYSTAQAIDYVRAVNGARLDFFEQPVSAENLAGIAEVAAASGIAVGADEGIHSLDDIERHHASKAARGVSLKAIKLGGISAVAAAARLCDRLGMQVNISCKTGEIEHRLRCSPARRRGRPQYRLGPHAHPHRARRRCDRTTDPDRQRSGRNARPAGLGDRCRRGARAAPPHRHPHVRELIDRQLFFRAQILRVT